MKNTRVTFLLLVFLISCIIDLSSANRDFYKILGVSRDATSKEISKAYRQLALKYHPDKNADDEVAQKKFVEISEAYDVLNDPKKKEIYDHHGEQGLNQGGGGGHHGGFHFGGARQAFNMFEQFFGGGGGQHTFTFSTDGGFGGGHHHQQRNPFGQQQQQRQQPPRQKKKSPVDLYNLNGNIHQISDRNFEDTVHQSSDFWILQLYTTSESSFSFIQEFNNIVNNLKTYFKFAIVDGETEGEILQKLGTNAQDSPKLFFITANSITAYSGELKAKPIIDWAINQMPSYSVSVTSVNFAKFVRDHPTKPKILLFTNKQGTSALFNTLAKQNRNKFDFGVVTSSDVVLIDRFHIKKFPTILIPVGDGLPSIVFDRKDMDLKSLQSFLNENLKAPTSYRWRMQKIDKENSNLCVSSGICGLFVPSEASQLEMMNENLETLRNRYNNFEFGYIDASQTAFLKQFQVEKPFFVVLNHKKSRMIVKSVDGTLESVSELLDQVKGGQVSNWETFSASPLSVLY